MSYHKKYLTKHLRKLVGLTAVVLIALFQVLYYAARDPSVYLSEESIFSGHQSADSPELIQWLRQKIILPPSKLPYNLKYANNLPQIFHSSDGHIEVVQHLLGDMRNGTFIECGGFDGESLSNTLYFEKYRGWKGLLIEPDDKNFAKLITKNRKAFVANACISETNRTTYEPFNNNRAAGSGLVSNAKTVDNMLLHQQEFQVAKCFPFYSYVLAMNYRTIDYFALDVEGSELKILSNIPWNKVDIRTMSVEYMLHEKPEEISKLMESKDYVHFMTLNSYYTNDYFFIKKSILSNKWSSYKLPVFIEGLEMLHKFLNGSLNI